MNNTSVENIISEQDKAALTDSAADLIYLVSCALNETAPDPRRCAGMDLRQVYVLARFHSLTGAAAFALEQVTELPHEFDQAKKKAIRKQALFDIERKKIAAEFEKEGIWYLPLKGIILKELYPKSFMREMNDNDILCNSARMDTVKEIMTRLGYTCVLYDEYHHDSYQKPPVLEFEMHRTLTDPNYDPVLAAYFDDIKDKLIDDGGCARRMPDEDFYLYLIVHTFKHYSSGGTGLRSLADVYVFCKRYGGSLDWNYIEGVFRNLAVQGIHTAQAAYEKDLERDRRRGR